MKVRRSAAPHHLTLVIAMIGGSAVAARCLAKIFPTFFPNRPSGGIYYGEAHAFSRQANGRKDGVAVDTENVRAERKE